MKPAKPTPTRHRGQDGSVLIIVLWIVFGLVAITLYFGHSMAFELHSSDNRVAAVEADQAIQGAMRYVTFVLSNNITGAGTVPDPQSYQAEAVKVGEARFWLIGRTNVDDGLPENAHFGLVDEASKLNLNEATADMLALLPRMTPDLAASITTWRAATTNSANTNNGAQSDTYQRMQPPYLCKNAPFETVDELRLIYQMDMDTLFGEDANLNGVLDRNENDGDALPPSDDQNGRLDPGLLEYVTVYTQEPTTTTNGDQRVDISTADGLAQLSNVFSNKLDSSRVSEILQAAGNTPYQSVLEFYIASKMTQEEFYQVERDIRGPRIKGLVNVNTASATVLSCLPGMDIGKANQLVSYRQGSVTNLNTVGWVSQVLDTQTIAQVGPWLTGLSYQFTADVAALGHHGRGYKRVKFVFDLSQGGAPLVLYRQDLSHLGWALGKQARDRWLLEKVATR